MITSAMEVKTIKIVGDAFSMTVHEYSFVPRALKYCIHFGSCGFA